jgi:hypothetical protein
MLDKSASHWHSIRRIEDFRPVLAERGLTSLVWFAVRCLARIRHLLVLDAMNMADLIEAHAEAKVDRLAVVEAYQSFLQSHYSPHIVRSQEDTCDIDIGKFDSPGAEAVAEAAYLVAGDLISPDDDRFQSTRARFWLAEGMAECCRQAVMANIPQVPWHQEELPAELEPFREALLALLPGQRYELRRTLELDPRLHAVQQALLEASHRRDQRRNAAWETEEIAQCNLAREVIPPPYVTSFGPAWRTSNVLGIATVIDNGRDFNSMPILADALEDAGCEDMHILGHCRDPGAHAHGCWVIQLILGRG